MTDQDRHPGDFGAVVGDINIIRIASKTESFKNWLNNRYPSISPEEVYNGYRFFLVTAVRTLINDIIYNTLPLFEEDYDFFRARFKGEKISQIPNTSDKTAIINNLNQYRRQIRNASTWDNISTILEEIENEVSIPIFALYSNHVVVEEDNNTKKSPDELLRYVSIFKLFTRFNDVDDGYPNGYDVTILEPGFFEERLDDALLGYALTLEFLWSNLLDSTQFEQTSASSIHNSNVWYEPSSVDIDPSDIEDLERMFEYQEVSEERQDLDRFFGKLNDEIITPIKEQTGLTPFDKLLYLSKEATSEPIEHLLDWEPSAELSEEQKFRQKLLWYQVEFLESSNIFNGGSAFISLLSGRIRLNQRFADGDRTLVCKFVHPDEEVNSYTYGVLVETRGTSGLSDYSGWIMFFDCCNDSVHSFSYSTHLLAERLLEEYIEKDQIELREMEISKEDFQNWVSEFTVGQSGENLTEIQKLESERDSLLQKVHRGRGLLLELVTHYYLSRRSSSEVSVDWNVPLENGEIDVVVEDGQEIRYIECKYDPSNQSISEEISKLNTKLESADVVKDSRGEFWFWKEPSTIDIASIQSAGYEYKIAPNTIDNSRHFRKKDLQNFLYIMEGESQ